MKHIGTISELRNIPIPPLNCGRLDISVIMVAVKATFGKDTAISVTDYTSPGAKQTNTPILKVRGGTRAKEKLNELQREYDDGTGHFEFLNNGIFLLLHCKVNISRGTNDTRYTLIDLNVLNNQSRETILAMDQKLLIKVGKLTRELQSKHPRLVETTPSFQIFLDLMSREPEESVEEPVFKKPKIATAEEAALLSTTTSLLSANPLFNAAPPKDSQVAEYAHLYTQDTYTPNDCYDESPKLLAAPASPNAEIDPERDSMSRESHCFMVTQETSNTSSEETVFLKKEDNGSIDDQSADNTVEMQVVSTNEATVPKLKSSQTETVFAKITSSFSSSGNSQGSVAVETYGSRVLGEFKDIGDFEDIIATSVGASQDTHSRSLNTTERAETSNDVKPEYQETEILSSGISDSIHDSDDEPLVGKEQADLTFDQELQESDTTEIYDDSRLIQRQLATQTYLPGDTLTITAYIVAMSPKKCRFLACPFKERPSTTPFRILVSNLGEDSLETLLPDKNTLAIDFISQVSILKFLGADEVDQAWRSVDVFYKGLGKLLMSRSPLEMKLVRKRTGGPIWHKDYWECVQTLDDWLEQI